MQEWVFGMTPEARVAWDIDGTICLNDAPKPDWQDPDAVTCTGESIYSEMLEFRKLNYLNPEMEQVNRSKIDLVITGRLDNSRMVTWNELERYGIYVGHQQILMYPWTFKPWTHRRNRISKENWIQQESVTHYVDNDPAFCEAIRNACKKDGYDVWCGSITEFLQLGLSGWVKEGGE